MKRAPAQKSAATPKSTTASKPATAAKSATPAKPAAARRPAAAKTTAAKTAAAKAAAAKAPVVKAPAEEPATDLPETETALTEIPAAESAATESPAAETETNVAPDTELVIETDSLADLEALIDEADATDTDTAADTEAAVTAPAPKRPAAPRKPVQRADASQPARAPRTPRTPARPRITAKSIPSVVRDIDPTNIVLSISGLVKKFGSTTAVAGIDIDVPQGSFYGIVGPNGAGKTTTLSMVTGLLRPDGGSITVHGNDVWRDPVAAKRLIGVLPDRLRLFDRLTGRQLLYYSGTLRGLDSATVAQRSDDLAAAFGLEEALGRLVTDYSAGMTKKIALACSMIHSPRILVLDEPFESVDPVSAANVVDILQKYVEGGGTVVLSSHSMDMIQRVCDRVAIIVEGRVLAKGTVDEVREGGSLERRFVELAGGRKSAEGMEWLLSSSD